LLEVVGERTVERLVDHHQHVLFDAEEEVWKVEKQQEAIGGADED